MRRRRPHPSAYFRFDIYRRLLKYFWPHRLMMGVVIEAMVNMLLGVCLENRAS